jgi:hypothetical protein
LYVHCYLPVDSLCLDGPGWEDRAKHSFDVVFEVIGFLQSALGCIDILFSFILFTGLSSQFASEESQHEPVILFLKDVEKICGNNYTYHGLKNKLESFPAGVFIVGSQIQTDARKDKVLHLRKEFTLSSKSLIVHLFLYN